MKDERTRCAEAALPGDTGERWGLTVRDLLAQRNGHHFFQGWHIGWAWGVGDDGRTYLDFLSEHRMAGLGADRYFADGTAEALDTPQEFRLVGKTPEEDARLEQEYFEHNRAAYENLRRLGLLPPSGGNLTSQDVNEFLRSGGDVNDPESG